MVNLVSFDGIHSSLINKLIFPPFANTHHPYLIHNMFPIRTGNVQNSLAISGGIEATGTERLKRIACLHSAI